MLSAITGLCIAACSGSKPPTVLPADEGFAEARRLYDRGKWEKARLAFESVIFNHPGSSLVDSAQYLYAMCYFKEEQEIIAAQEFLRVRRQYPTSELVDDADYMRCRSLVAAAPKNPGLDQERTQEAVNEILLFKDNHPLSERLSEVDSILQVAYGRLSTKDFKTGKLYYKLGRYQASRIYLQGMIDRYPESPLVPEAIFYMAEGQRKLDSLDNAVEYYEKLIYLYPDHKRTAKAKKRVAKIARNRGEAQANGQ
jgi:outer membrane protein assembly factor BamD